MRGDDDLPPTAAFSATYRSVRQDMRQAVPEFPVARVSVYADVRAEELLVAAIQNKATNAHLKGIANTR